MKITVLNYTVHTIATELPMAVSLSVGMAHALMSNIYNSAKTGQESTASEHLFD
jgi:hypothetical protein